MILHVDIFVSPLIKGLILRLPLFGKVPKEHLFDDHLSWEVPHADDELHPMTSPSDTTFELAVRKCDETKN